MLLIQLTGLDVADAPTDTTGVPPSSSISFLRANSSLPAVVLTDYTRQYSNRFYHSRFDRNSYITSVNIATLPSSSCPVCQRICNAATFIARSLYTVAGGTNDTFRSNLVADCTEVSSLLECLTKDSNCALARSIMPSLTSSTPQTPVNYPSVYRIIRRDLVTGSSRFIYEYLKSFSSSSRVPSRYNGSAHFHDAVDPSLVFDYSKSKWSVASGATSPVWTESNWGTLSTRVYRRENPTVSYIMLGLGIGITILSIGLSQILYRYCKRKFKTI